MNFLHLFRTRCFLLAYCIAAILFLIAGTSLAERQVSVPVTFSGTVPASSGTEAISMDLTSSETKQLAFILTPNR